MKFSLIQVVVTLAAGTRIMMEKNKSECWIMMVMDFFLACEDYGRTFDHSFPACAVCLFFVQWRLAHTH